MYHTELRCELSPTMNKACDCTFVSSMSIKNKRMQHKATVRHVIKNTAMMFVSLKKLCFSILLIEQNFV